MIIVTGGQKGGTGKSTIATNLAVARAAAGRDVLLIDADEQQSSSDFTALRNGRLGGGAGYTNISLHGRAVRTETLRLKAKHDDVVIDAGGRDTDSQRAALTVADVALVPFVPRSFDMWTLGVVDGLVEEVLAVNPGLRAYAFLNRCDPTGGDNDDAADLIRNEARNLLFLDAGLGNRKAYAKAAASGLGVAELRPLDEKAAAEAARLHDAVFGGA